MTTPLPPKPPRIMPPPKPPGAPTPIAGKAISSNPSGPTKPGKSNSTTGGPIEGPDPSKRVLGTSTNPIYVGGGTVMSSINSLERKPSTIEQGLRTPPNRGSNQNRNPWTIGRVVGDLNSGAQKVIGAQNSVIDSIGNAALRPFSALGSLFGNDSSTPGAGMMNKLTVPNAKEKLPYVDNSRGKIAKKITK